MVFDRAKSHDRARRQAELGRDRAQILSAEAEKAGSATANLTAAVTGRLQPKSNTNSGGGRVGTLWSAEPLGNVRPEQSLLLGVTLPIYDGGSSQAAVTEAAAGQAAADALRTEAEADLAQRVALLCVRYLGTGVIGDINTLQLKSAETRFATLRSAYARGERSELDLTRAEFELRRARIARDRADAEELLLARDIDELIGADTNASDTALASPAPRLQLQVTRLPLTEWVAFWGTLRQQATRAPGNVRRQASRKNLAAKLERIEAKAAPTVQFQSSMGLGGSLSPLRPLAQAELRVVYPLGWNRTTDEEREHVLLDLRSLEEEEEHDTRSRNHTRKRLAETIEQRNRERAAWAGQLTVLERLRRLMQRRYDAGRASALELAEAEDQLLAARLEGARLEEQIMMHIINYSSAAGLSDFTQLLEKDEQQP